MEEQLIDPFLRLPVTVTRVHPFQAAKAYMCPGCENEVGKGIGHVVVVPIDAPDLRRHWHHSCWDRREQRGPGRRHRRRH